MALHLDLSHNHEAGLIPVATQNLLRALSARLAVDAKAHEKELAVWVENYAALERKLVSSEARVAKLLEVLTEALRVLEVPFGVVFDPDPAIASIRAALDGDKT